MLARCTVLTSFVFLSHCLSAAESLDRSQLNSLLTAHCRDCHAGDDAEGGFNVSKLTDDISDEATFARWERVFVRVNAGEMPPADAEPIPQHQKEAFTETLGRQLRAAHAKAKSTVYRRLNRREYQNTMNDIFGTRLELESRLPEDGRSHEFDNVGSALGMSLVHLQQYLAAANDVLDAAIEKVAERPPIQTVTASYADTREGQQFIGRFWKKLPDGAVAFFQRMGYPSGMLRGTEVRPAGRYKIRITGYAYRSEEPITMRVGGTSFLRGTGKPTYGYFELPPGKPSTVELEADIAERFMVTIDPWDIDTGSYNLRKQGVQDYDGPGLAINKVELIGPIIEQFPSRGHQLVMDGFERTPLPKKKWEKVQKFEVTSKNPEKDAERMLLRVASKAFRRPVAANEIERYSKLFRDQLQSGTDLETSLRTAITAVFCSPDFLYLQEPEVTLDAYSLASRLSYFLTRSTPDDELLAVAASGKLLQDEVLLREVGRLLRDDKSNRFVADFCDAWLNLRDIEFTSPDRQLFPEFDQYLQYSMIEETTAFVSRLIGDNLPVRNIVKSDFAMLNERLADHYDLPSVSGPKIHSVKLPPDSLRGGILSQASVLKVSANGTNTSPVVRGVWVMERILGKAPQPPPPGIPGVEPDIRGATTLRELLDKHRDVDSCRACHAMIDPPGFAMECFNPIGGFRERFRSLGEGERTDKAIAGRRVRYRIGKPVDTSGQLADGSEFQDFNGFRELVAADSNTLATALTTKLLTFATGRDMGFSDRPVIREIVEKTQPDGHCIRDLIEQIVLSDSFRTK